LKKSSATKFFSEKPKFVDKILKKSGCIHKFLKKNWKKILRLLKREKKTCESEKTGYPRVAIGTS